MAELGELLDRAQGASGLDIEVGAPLDLLLGEARFEKDVRQERIVDLEQEAGRDPFGRLALEGRCGQQ